MAQLHRRQNNAAQEIRDANEYSWPVLTLYKPEQVLVTIVNTHDKAFTIKLKGTLKGDATMTNPSIDTEETIGIGSGTTTVISMESHAKWDYVRVSATASGGVPTTGDITVTISAPRER